MLLNWNLEPGSKLPRQPRDSAAVLRFSIWTHPIRSLWSNSTKRPSVLAFLFETWRNRPQACTLLQEQGLPKEEEEEENERTQQMEE